MGHNISIFLTLKRLKEMNYKIGKFAKQVEFGGVFPWTLNYDSFVNNIYVNSF